MESDEMGSDRPRVAVHVVLALEIPRNQHRNDKHDRHTVPSVHIFHVEPSKNVYSIEVKRIFN